MILPRLTNIHTVDLYLSSGAVIRQEYYRYHFKHTPSGFTETNVLAANGGIPPHIPLDHLVAVNHIRTRRVIRLRHREV